MVGIIRYRFGGQNGTSSSFAWSPDCSTERIGVSFAPLLGMSSGELFLDCLARNRASK
jgi:hypothetical protein